MFGSCVPSLVVENKSAETIDFLQVDLTIVLNDGQQRTVPLQSAYHEGVLYPIAPGGKAILKQPLDLSRSLGVGCGELKSRIGRPHDLRGRRQGLRLVGVGPALKFLPMRSMEVRGNLRRRGHGQ